jgi:hypothetical protein
MYNVRWISIIIYDPRSYPAAFSKLTQTISLLGILAKFHKFQSIILFHIYRINLDDMEIANEALTLFAFRRIHTFDARKARFDEKTRTLYARRHRNCERIIQLYTRYSVTHERTLLRTIEQCEQHDNALDEYLYRLVVKRLNLAQEFVANTICIT